MTTSKEILFAAQVVASFEPPVRQAIILVEAGRTEEGIAVLRALHRTLEGAMGAAIPGNAAVVDFQREVKEHVARRVAAERKSKTAAKIAAAKTKAKDSTPAELRRVMGNDRVSKPTIRRHTRGR